MMPCLWTVVEMKIKQMEDRKLKHEFTNGAHNHLDDNVNETFVLNIFLVDDIIVRESH